MPFFYNTEPRLLQVLMKIEKNTTSLANVGPGMYSQDYLPTSRRYHKMASFFGDPRNE